MVLLPFLSSATKFGVTILQVENKPWRKRDFFVLKDKEWLMKEEINLDYKR